MTWVDVRAGRAYCLDVIRLAVVAAFSLALAAPAAARADDEVVEEAKDEEVVEATPAPEELLHQLQGERKEILEELAALEEGWSDYKKDDEGPDEAEMKARLDRLLKRLESLDADIADIEREAG